MGTSFWDDFKKTVTDGFNVAAKKTKEYTAIGKLEIDILNLKRAVEKNMKDLGKQTYNVYKSGQKGDISEDKAIKKLINTIDDLYAEIKSKEKEIEEIKKEEDKKKSSGKKSDTKPAGKTTGAKKTASSKPVKPVKKTPAKKTAPKKK
ncbi:hypothetical protein DRQ07_06535 [candidate division KSB1 bacterium]|nr:MAG: hypothetical protein DRQ07_06535 [candidate division KSB1 bacterium]